MPIDLRDKFLGLDESASELWLVWKRVSGDHIGEKYSEPPEVFFDDINGMDQREMTFDVSEALRQLEAEANFLVCANDNFI